VVPVFPGETTLNAASTLASQGELSLWLMMLAGGLGAIAGDSTLFLIARRSDRSPGLGSYCPCCCSPSPHSCGWKC
jgi:membrane protein DedA with SNARE-associated domain